MATLKVNQFTSYELTTQEYLSGCVLTENQKWVLQNRLSDLAMQKINLEFDPEHPSISAREVAYKQGQIDEIQSLLQISDDAAEKLGPVAVVSTQQVQHPNP